MLVVLAQADLLGKATDMLISLFVGRVGVGGRGGRLRAFLIRNKSTEGLGQCADLQHGSINQKRREKIIIL